MQIQPIFIGFIAGVSFAKPDIELLSFNDNLHAIPEPTNEFDARAIRIVHPVAGKLGYIPRDATNALHIAWGHDLEVEIKITDIIENSRGAKLLITATIDLDSF